MGKSSKLRSTLHEMESNGSLIKSGEGSFTTFFKLKDGEGSNRCVIKTCCPMRKALYELRNNSNVHIPKYYTHTPLDGEFSYYEMEEYLKIDDYVDYEQLTEQSLSDYRQLLRIEDRSMNTEAFIWRNKSRLDRWIRKQLEETTISEPVKEAFLTIWGKALLITERPQLEFPTSNLARDSEGNLILLDVVFCMNKNREVRKRNR